MELIPAFGGLRYIDIAYFELFGALKVKDAMDTTIQAKSREQRLKRNSRFENPES